MDMTRKLSALAKVMKANFTLNGKPISYEKVFSDTGLLPALARRADQLCSLCLGYGIGASFDETDKATLQVRVKFDEVTPEVLRILCICDVLSEIINAAQSKESTPLDELMYD
jgi:intracellular multiplication protein IcmS